MAIFHIIRLKLSPNTRRMSRNPSVAKLVKRQANKIFIRTSSQSIRATRLLERLHTNLVWPVRPATRYKYQLVATDDFSRYAVIKPLQTKDEIVTALAEIINTLEKASINAAAQIQADWGGEFPNKELTTELKQRRRILTKRSPGTVKQMP